MTLCCSPLQFFSKKENWIKPLPTPNEFLPFIIKFWKWWWWDTAQRTVCYRESVSVARIKYFLLLRHFFHASYPTLTGQPALYSFGKFRFPKERNVVLSSVSKMDLGWGGGRQWDNYGQKYSLIVISPSGKKQKWGEISAKTWTFSLSWWPSLQCSASSRRQKVQTAA